MPFYSFPFHSATLRNLSLHYTHTHTQKKLLLEISDTIFFHYTSTIHHKLLSRQQSLQPLPHTLASQFISSHKPYNFILKLWLEYLCTKQQYIELFVCEECEHLSWHLKLSHWNCSVVSLCNHCCCCWFITITTTLEESAMAREEIRSNSWLGSAVAHSNSTLSFGRWCVLRCTFSPGSSIVVRLNIVVAPCMSMQKWLVSLLSILLPVCTAKNDWLVNYVESIWWMDR